MGIFFFLSSSPKRTIRKLNREINYVTKTKKKFDQKSNSFVLSALKYNNNKSKILVDVIKTGLSNVNAVFEKRYLYLCLLDKLIISKVVFLQHSYQNNLLSYIVMLSDTTDKKQYFKYSEKEENVMLLCNLAISCINKWYEKYSLMNDKSIEILRNFMNNYFSNSSEIESNSRECETKDFELNNLTVAQNDILLPEKSNISSNIEPEVEKKMHSPLSHNSISSNKFVESCIGDKNDISDKETSKNNSNDSCDYIPTQHDVLEKVFNEDNTNKIKESLDTDPSIIESKSIGMNCFDNSKLYSEIKTMEMKYNLLKEKYLFLVKKNEYLQSRLEYHEDFNVFTKTNTQDDCFKEKKFQLFNNLSNIAELGDVFLENFNNLILNNDWILFEDNIIQIGLKFQFSDNFGYLNLYFGNKLPTRLEDFAITFNFSNIYPKALSIKKQDEVEHPSYVTGKQQICFNFEVECSDVYIGVPTVNVKFLLTDNTLKEVELPFPIVVSKFSYGKELYSRDFVPNRWHSDVFLMSQASTQTNTKSSISSISEIIDKCKLNDSFHLFVENDNEKAEKKIYLQGDVLNHQVIIQVSESTSHGFIIRVRSDSGILSNSILSIILFQINYGSF